MKSALTLIIGFTSFWVFAQSLNEAAQQSRLRHLYTQLRCPTCQGLSVKDSQAGFSRKIREKVQEMVKSGKTDEEIKAFFVKRYGDWILRAPPKEGFNLVLWLAPFALLLIAGFFTAKMVWRSTQEVKTSQELDSQPLSEQELQVVEKDFERFKKS